MVGEVLVHAWLTRRVALSRRPDFAKADAAKADFAQAEAWFGWSISHRRMHGFGCLAADASGGKSRARGLDYSPQPTAHSPQPIDYSLQSTAYRQQKTAYRKQITDYRKQTTDYRI